MYAKGLADMIASKDPDHLTTDIRKDKRGNRLFIDYLRNSCGQTGVAPCTIRARAVAPAAAPVRWDELDHIESQATASVISWRG